MAKFRLVTLVDLTTRTRRVDPTKKKSFRSISRDRVDVVFDNVVNVNVVALNSLPPKFCCAFSFGQLLNNLGYILFHLVTLLSALASFAKSLSWTLDKIRSLKYAVLGPYFFICSSKKQFTVAFYRTVRHNINTIQCRKIFLVPKATFACIFAYNRQIENDILSKAIDQLPN